MKSVCLIFPKSTFLEDPMVYPPLGLWYVWAELEKLGYEVDYRDLSEDELPLAHDTYFISGTSPQVTEIKRVVKTLKEEVPEARIVLGGSHAMTHDGQMLLGYGVDVVFKGEADGPLGVEDALTCKKGTVINIPFTPDLRHLSLPVRKAAYRYHAYLYDWEGGKHPTTTMFTSRGCPMRCAFCETQGIWGKRMRWTPFATVKREIEQIVEMGFTGIMFYDDIFPLNKPRTLKMLDVLKYHHKHNDLIWRCFLRTDVIEKHGGYEYLKLMREAGLREVLAGVESGSNQIKENVQKGTTIEQDTQALQWCKALGIAFKAALILGLPGETMETMQATKRWVLKNRPDRVDVNTLIPFPGTPLTENIADYDLYIDESQLVRGEFPEEYFYKGPRESGEALVGTAALTPEQIKDFRDGFVQEIMAGGIPY